MRKLRKVWMDQEAVSPVIAVILMVAITVVLAAVLYMWVQSVIPSGKSAPTVSAGLGQIDVERGYRIEITAIDRPVSGADVEYQLLDDKDVVVLRGDLNSVYNVKQRNPIDYSIISNVTWIDTNGDDKLSQGDRIYVLGEWTTTYNNEQVSGGIAEDGWTFRLIFSPTGALLATVELTGGT